MTYATELQLLQRHGNDEMAELASENSAVDGELLMLTVTGGDRSSYDSLVVHAADDALVRLQLVMSDAHKRIDSYLRERYALPLSAEQIAGSDLSRIQTTLSRYFLMENDPSDTVLKRYNDAISWLRDVSVGKASLGESDVTVSTDGTGTVRQGNSRIGWDNY